MTPAQSFVCAEIRVHGISSLLPQAKGMFRIRKKTRLEIEERENDPYQLQQRRLAMFAHSSKANSRSDHLLLALIKQLGRWVVE